MAVVEVRNLHKSFGAGKVHAIDGIDLSTAEGEYLVLLGPSGCGKTSGWSTCPATGTSTAR